jgi:ABC-type tungstate transport system permease subunit
VERAGRPPRTAWSRTLTVDADGARSFTEFVRPPDGRALIGAFGVKTLGEPLFTPDE